MISAPVAVTTPTKFAPPARTTLSAVKSEIFADATVATPEILTLSNSVCPTTSTPARPEKVDIPAVTTIPPVVTLTPLPAVTIPTESTLITSSYVSVPPIDTLPAKVATPAILTLSKFV